MNSKFFHKEMKCTDIQWRTDDLAVIHVPIEENRTNRREQEQRQPKEENQENQNMQKKLREHQGHHNNTHDKDLRKINDYSIDICKKKKRQKLL